MTWKLKAGRQFVRNVLSSIAAATALVAIGSTSQAAPIAIAMNAPITAGGAELTPFTVSNMDVGETLGTWSLVGGSAAFGSDVTKLNNGIKYIDPVNGSGETTESFTPSGGTVARLSFSEPVDISSIESLSAFIAARVQQDFSVEYSNDGMNFNPLIAVDGSLANNVDAGNLEVVVSIVDPTPSFLATNVQALQFTFNNTARLAKPSFAKSTSLAKWLKPCRRRRASPFGRCWQFSA